MVFKKELLKEFVRNNPKEDGCLVKNTSIYGILPYQTPKTSSTHRAGSSGLQQREEKKKKEDKNEQTRVHGEIRGRAAKTYAVL